MMEGFNQMGQEEYIWAMRTSAYSKSDTDLNIISSAVLKAKSKSGMEISADDVQTKTMASLVPDEVIYNVDDYSHRHYEACFLFGDVSGIYLPLLMTFCSSFLQGFTELCEKYTRTGVSGPSRMTQALNKYLGSMVQEVMSHNGDVLKFSGDAFLAIFKLTETETMRDAVHETLDCALVIQKNYGSYLTDVGVAIRVKLAISAGFVTFALIGDETTSHYVVVGKPIWDVKAAESISSAGDIVVAPAAWHYVNANEYLYQEMPDNIHIKIVGVGPNWRSVQKSDRQQRTVEQDETLSHLSEESGDSDVLSDRTIEGATDEFSLRPAVNTAVRLRIKESLRRFIIAPVMKSIDMDEPFEYLTEMRQAVIVFINVVSSNLKTEETVILADRTYKIVCSVVDKMKGCVNKVSLFDKDLMFVVIFGLRGLKHELECQVALRCAKECHTAIDQLPGVLSTSIGVTTGKTYCGVFGHTLRREYTVISLIVNKAARLMVAYKGKVTCDRETFLHSKLEARHFILQEFRPLKGISRPGPIYEFKELEEDHDVIPKINACPLLGRTEELKLYSRLLEKCSRASEKERQYKMLLITGEARQGKTRLLDELVYITPREILINKFSLSAKDFKVPYQTIRLIFNLALSLTKESSTNEREKRLFSVFQKLQVSELLCVLNDVFGTTFKNSEIYLSFNEVQKKLVQRKMIKQLCQACFVKLWVLAIDNCDFMDKHSLDIIDTLFDIKTLFIVATMSRDKPGKSATPDKVFQDSRVKIVHLKPIERWYLGALVCQILDVYAISAELENAIQTRSNGNPGWIESFLISLIQDGSLYILKATLSQINDLGLVCPPLYMMARLSEEDTVKWQEIMEEKHYFTDSSTLRDDDKWKRYIDSCRDSFLNVAVREEMEAISKDSKVPICIISPNFRVANEEMELSMDAMILKSFDSLNFFEQLLVKCSAILGNQFYRDMLLYVMSATDKRKAALAVQKLFEIHVLTCAKGDFSEGGNYVFQERLENPIEQHELKCQCRGLKIDESCADLPKYASCGYLQFRSSLFREITYNLLTDNQKKEFHQRAIRYLEIETRKCRACGNGFFEGILSIKRDKDLVIAKSKPKKGGIDYGGAGTAWEASSASHGTSWHSLSQYSGGIHDGSLSRASTGTGASFDFPRRAKFYENLVFRRKSKGTKSYWRVFGLSVTNKLKDSFSLTRAFSTEDFTDCQCNLILSTTYAQLIEHCTGAGNLTKVIDAMLQYAYVCIISSNTPLAMTVLYKALEVLKQKAREQTENLWKLSIVRAKIFTLIGYCYIELGYLDRAQENLFRSLNEYGIIFPKGVSKQIKNYSYRLKHILGFYLFPKMLRKRLDYWETVYANNLSECLSHLCTLYMVKEEWDNAEMAAVWSLSKALESFSDFQVICIACANMIVVAQHFHRWNICMALEIHALRLCHLKKSSIDIEEMKSVCKLYFTIFISRLNRTEMEKAIQMGYIVLRLSCSVQAVKIVFPVVPLLMQALLTGKHFNNAHSILQELHYFSKDDTDSSGKVWYFALCLSLQIETGYTVVPYQLCQNFYLFEGESWVTIRDPDAKRRFFTIMWLWCVRNEHFEAAAAWCMKTNDFALVSENDSIANKITALYLLEGLIIHLVYKMDRHNVHEMSKTEAKIRHLFQALDKAAKPTKFILPRLYHLKAYYRFVKKNDSKVEYFKNKALRFAEKQSNFLEISWIHHSEKSWNRNLSGADADFWKEHSEADHIEFEKLELGGERIGFFTLPTPLYM